MEEAHGPGAARPRAAAMEWWQWLIVGCGGLVVIVAAVAALVALGVTAATAGPEKVVQEFLEQAGQGDYAAAHQHFSTALKEAQPYDAFAAMAGANPGFFKVTETTFNQRSVDESGASLVGTVTLESGDAVPASFRLVEEEGEWRLVGYEIGQ